MWRDNRVPGFLDATAGKRCWGLLLIAALLGSGCGSVRMMERQAPVLYKDQPASILNSNLVSPGSRELLREWRRDPSPARRVEPEMRIAAAEAQIRAARDWRNRHPGRALGAYVEAARALWGEEILEPSGEAGQQMRRLYNHACGEAAILAHRLRATEQAAEGKVVRVSDVQFEVARSGTAVLDPLQWADVAGADRAVVKGLRQRVIQDGLGGMLSYKLSPAAADELSARGRRPQLAFPATAVLTFSERGKRVLLTCYDVLEEDEATVGRRKVKLASDFTVPLAMTLETAAGLRVGIMGMFRPAKFIDQTQLHTYLAPRGDRIPVVMTHGLMSVPSAFREMLNGLMADEVIRKNYQFWFFRYPSGVPLGYSSAGLRESMQALRTTLGAGPSTPALDRFVLIGHSMGGLVSSVQIRDYDEQVMRKLVRLPMSQLVRDEAAAQRVRDLMAVAPQPFVDRVIFISTPHRGSPLALKPIARFGASLIRLPMDLLSVRTPTVLQATTELGRSLLTGDFNSINLLQSDSPVLRLLNDLPRDERVVCHSIIGNRGRKGPLEQSSDGVVPYWSSHIDWAVSEKIVPSHHDAQMHPEAIEEVRRILHEHLESDGR
ncbi:MAG TPA: hypothetical protein VMN36_14155 [Verrucomicrobiales bacterium]|nr:hypothetical protein [Verrucomicrobiales bacterium]